MELLNSICKVGCDKDGEKVKTDEFLFLINHVFVYSLEFEY